MSGDSDEVTLQETQTEKLRREKSVTTHYSGWDFMLVKGKFRVGFCFPKSSEKGVCKINL